MFKIERGLLHPMFSHSMITWLYHFTSLNLFEWVANFILRFSTLTKKRLDCIMQNTKRISWWGWLQVLQVRENAYELHLRAASLQLEYNTSEVYTTASSPKSSLKRQKKRAVRKSRRSALKQDQELLEKVLPRLKKSSKSCWKLHISLHSTVSISYNCVLSLACWLKKADTVHEPVFVHLHQSAIRPCLRQRKTLFR